jgi:hypothetical protein
LTHTPAMDPEAAPADSSPDVTTDEIGREIRDVALRRERRRRLAPRAALVGVLA